MKLRILFAFCIGSLLAVGRTGFSQLVITDFSPTAGSAGDTIVINGSGFTSSPITVLFWNNVPASSIFIASDNQINATVPSGVTTGVLSIKTSSGSQIFSSAQFTAIGLGPYISGFSPDVGAVNDFVSILGVHFTGTSAVTFNGVNAPNFNLNSSGTQISVFVPPGATTGPVSVTTPLGTSNSPTVFTIIGPGPYISDFTPVSGSAGTPVNITGRFFTGATSVKFNGVGAAFSSTTDTSIAAVAPANVTTGPITVTTPAGSYTTTNNYFLAPPTISSFSPAAGRAGTNVQITGTSFLGATAVTFNGLPATSFSVINNTNIQAVVPTGATDGVIQVITPVFSAPSTKSFTVQPTLYGFTPIFGAVGSSITITGANFNVGTPTIRFNGVQAATPTGVSFSKLTAVVPAGATTGPISVTTTDGSHTNSSNFFLPASITSFSPTNTPPGTQVSIKGQNFIGATAVKFGGVAASFNVTSNTFMAATVPNNVLSGPITVTTPAGTATNTALFYGAPVIASFTPTHGLPATAVTIRGVNFLGTTAVRFNALAASITSLNNTQLVVTVPSGAQTGPLTVVAPAGTNTSTQLFTLDYTSDLAVSLTNSANPVTVGSNLLYTISVVNNGPYAALNVQLSELLPTTVQLISAGITGNWGVTTNGSMLSATTTNLSVGGSATLTLGVIPLLPGNITNTVSVTSSYTDPFPANNSAFLVTTVQPLPVLAIGVLGKQVKISWPAALTNFVLQARGSLAPGISWTGVTTIPAIVGDTKSVVETNTSPAKYYRLKQ